MSSSCSTFFLASNWLIHISFKNVTKSRGVLFCFVNCTKIREWTLASALQEFLDKVLRHHVKFWLYFFLASIWLIHISIKNLTKSRGVLFCFVNCIHSREWTLTSALQYLLKLLNLHPNVHSLIQISLYLVQKQW